MADESGKMERGLMRGGEKTVGEIFVDDQYPCVKDEGRKLDFSSQNEGGIWVV